MGEHMRSIIETHIVLVEDQVALANSMEEKKKLKMNFIVIEV